MKKLLLVLFLTITTVHSQTWTRSNPINGGVFTFSDSISDPIEQIFNSNPSIYIGVIIQNQDGSTAVTTGNGIYKVKPGRLTVSLPQSGDVMYPFKIRSRNTSSIFLDKLQAFSPSNSFTYSPEASEEYWFFKLPNGDLKVISIEIIGDCEIQIPSHPFAVEYHSNGDFFRVEFYANWCLTNERMFFTMDIPIYTVGHGFTNSGEVSLQLRTDEVNFTTSNFGSDVFNIGANIYEFTNDTSYIRWEPSSNTDPFNSPGRLSGSIQMYSYNEPQQHDNSFRTGEVVTITFNQYIYPPTNE